MWRPPKDTIRDSLSMLVTQSASSSSQSFFSSLSIYVTFFQTWHLLQKFRGDKIRVKRVWWVLSANFTPGWFGIGIRYCPDGDQFIDILPILSAWPWDSRRLVQGGKVPFALSFLCLAVFFSFQPCWIYFYSLTPSSSAVTIEPVERCTSRPLNCDKANWNSEKMHSNFGQGVSCSALSKNLNPYMGWDQSLLNNSNRLVVWL